jgi:hemolysin activation/secretion protein
VGALGLFLPLTADGLRLNLEGTRSVTQPEGGFFRTRGSFRKFAGRLSYPLIKSRRKNLYLGAAVERLIERQTAPDFGVGLYEDRFTIARLSADYDKRWSRTAATLSATFSGGHGAEPIDLPLSRAGATEDFLKAEMRASHSVGLAGFALQTMARGQMLLSGGLPSSEIFSLDGPDALSPFQSGRLSADEGATVRLELSRPMPVAQGRIILSPFVYGAAAIAGFEVPTPFDVSRAAALGIGLNADFQPLLAGIAPGLSLDWGRQFTNGIAPDEWRFTAAFTARF